MLFADTIKTADFNKPSVRPAYTYLNEICQTVIKVGKCVEDTYNVLRTPAKEVLLAVFSDMDRMIQAQQNMQSH